MAWRVLLASVMSVVTTQGMGATGIPLNDFSTDPALASPPWTTAGDQWYILPNGYKGGAWWGSETTNPTNKCITLNNWNTANPSDTNWYWNQALTPKIDVTPLSYYKISFDYKLDHGKVLIAFDGYNPDPNCWGKWNATQVLYPDWTGAPITPTNTWTNYTWYSRARDNSTQSNLRFETTVYDKVKQTLNVDNVMVNQVTNRSEIASWANTNYQNFPKAATARANLAQYKWDAILPPTTTRFDSIKRTMAKLETGQDVTIVFFGDSLACDTGDSYLDVLLESKYKSHVKIINAVGSGTSMASWQNAADNPTGNGMNFKEQVVNQLPDLVIMPGISGSNNLTEVNAVRSMVARVRNEVSLYDKANGGSGYTPDVVLMAVESRYPLAAATSATWKANPVDDYSTTTGYASTFRNSLYHLSIEQNTGFLDLEGACGQYMKDYQAAGGDYTTLFRDGWLHLNNDGKILSGQAMLSYLTVVPEPASIAVFAIGAACLTLRRRSRVSQRK